MNYVQSKVAINVRLSRFTNYLSNYERILLTLKAPDKLHSIITSTNYHHKPMYIRKGATRHATDNQKFANYRLIRTIFIAGPVPTKIPILSRGPTLSGQTLYQKPFRSMIE